MNILIIGKPSKNLEKLLKLSKYTDKIYTAVNGDFSGFPNIEYRNLDELLNKALALKIDIIINTDKTLIRTGVAEFFKSKRVNLISVNKKWLNLETSSLSAKDLLKYYNINTPAIIRTPLAFPVLVKTDESGKCFVASSMNEVVLKMEEFSGEKIYFEEYTDLKTFPLYSIWDQKNIKFYYKEQSLTEVQKDRIDLLKTKLNFMFSDEKADFTGFFLINIIWYKNDWYVKDFDMGKVIPFEYLEDKDFVYILNSALYQKLDEI